MSAVVGMMDHLTGWWFPTPAGHVQSVTDQFGSEMVSDRPAHHSSTPRVDNDSQIHLPLSGGMFGDVAMKFMTSVTPELMPLPIWSTTQKHKYSVSPDRL